MIQHQKLEYNQFNMKKWDIKRQLVSKLIDVVCDRKRSQILLQFWIVTATQFWTLKVAAKYHKERCFFREQEQMKDFLARKIQKNWLIYTSRCAPTEYQRI